MALVRCTTLDGTIEAHNLAMAKLVGMDIAPGTSLALLFGAEGASDLLADLQRCLTLRTRLQLDVRVHLAGITRHLRANLGVVGDAPSEMIAACFVDLTPEKEAEEAARREHMQLRRSARQDALTGALNRRHFFRDAERRLAEMSEQAVPSSVLMLDLDHFKRLNDTFGHDVGDQALLQMGATCLRALRDVDLLGRVGGEEFAILLVGTDLDHGRRVGERLRRAIEALRIPTRQGNTTVTASLGLSRVSPGDALADALRRADRALYEAKRRSRNVLAVYEELTWDDE